MLDACASTAATTSYRASVRPSTTASFGPDDRAIIISRPATNISNLLNPTALTEASIALELSNEIDMATSLRLRHLPAPSYTQKLLSLLEGPWAPTPHDLPERHASREVGRSPLPFRQKPADAAATSNMKRAKRLVCKSERQWALTPWSTMYEYDVPVRNLPVQLQNLSILHLSDVHLLAGDARPIGELEALATSLEQTNRRLDLAILSGDLITKSPEDLCQSALRALQRISAACSFSCMVRGNHDYHGHRPAFISHELLSTGFRDITNKHVRLNIDGVNLNLFGVDDEYFGQPVVPRAVPADQVNLLITHNLDAIRRDCASGIDVIFSGHTHWGEMRGFDGVSIMRLWGYSENINRHTKHWDVLTDRTLSYVHPGLARYYVPWKGLRHPPGFAIHTLVPHPQDNQ